MFRFACDSIEGLTLNQKRETLKALKAAISADIAQKREMKEQLKIEKAQSAEFKRQIAIERAQERLNKLLAKSAKPVGNKAIKANRKPSKVTTLQVEAREANEIARKFASKKTA